MTDYYLIHRYITEYGVDGLLTLVSELSPNTYKKIIKEARSKLIREKIGVLLSADPVRR